MFFIISTQTASWQAMLPRIPMQISCSQKKMLNASFWVKWNEEGESDSYQMKCSLYLLLWALIFLISKLHWEGHLCYPLHAAKQLHPDGEKELHLSIEKTILMMTMVLMVIAVIELFFVWVWNIAVPILYDTAEN